MLDFKDVNYIVGKKSDIQSGFSKIMSFYDIIGHNMLLLHHEDNDSGLAYWTHSAHKRFSKLNSDIIKDSLFRVDYLVVDVYLSATFLNLKEFESTIRKITEIPIIFIIYVDPKMDLDESYKMSFINKVKNRSDITIHKISKKEIPSHIKLGQNRGNISSPYLSNDSDYIVSNICEKWETSFKELKLGYIRNKKLEDIFKEDEEG